MVDVFNHRGPRESIEKNVTAFEPSSPSFIGVAIYVNERGIMELAAISTCARIAVYNGDVKSSHSLRTVLVGASGCLVGFGMVKIAMHIKQSLGHDVYGYDLPAKSPGHAVYEHLGPSATAFDIDHLWDSGIERTKKDKKIEHLCLRAWISQRLASHEEWAEYVSAAKVVARSRLSALEFKHVFSVIKEVDMIEATKPRIVENDFSRVQHTEDSVIIHNERYKTRVRNSGMTRVVFVDTNGRKYRGRTTGANGRRTFIEKTAIKSTAIIEQVKVEGREELTNAEQARDDFLLRLLQGEQKLSDPTCSFIGYLWFPALKKLNLKRITNARSRTGCGERLLNQSQANVVEAMVNTHRPIVVTHGPPGTGKTTTISVAMREMHAARKTAWVVAQSNVGVKNIAESLCKHDVDFKLIVSKEFCYEWHEHIYVEVKDHLIRTDEFPPDPREVRILFDGIRIILCTLSTLSSRALKVNNLFALVPMETLVVDEASQIGILDYLQHLFGRFKELRKACFFWDPKQLPPHGRDAAPTLQSIFDIPHLKSSAYFLDTQYRMPCQIGEFISQAVYESKMKSVHEIKDWNCMKFVDVWNGTEEKAGKSWKNGWEVQSIVHLVRNYYRHEEFCVITPYDEQRNAIQKALKGEKLPWEDVYNVDSFQGNEARYVLVSVVRTTGPGFLKSQNRVNVMLTRCKAGMVIVTKREFTHYESVRKTLLGKLVLHWEDKVGKGNTWCKWAEVAEKKSRLPGVSAIQS